MAFEEWPSPIFAPFSLPARLHVRDPVPAGARFLPDVTFDTSHAAGSDPDGCDARSYWHVDIVQHRHGFVGRSCRAAGSGGCHYRGVGVRRAEAMKEQDPGCFAGRPRSQLSPSEIWRKPEYGPLSPRERSVVQPASAGEVTREAGAEVAAQALNYGAALPQSGGFHRSESALLQVPVRSGTRRNAGRCTGIQRARRTLLSLAKSSRLPA